MSANVGLSEIPEGLLLPLAVLVAVQIAVQVFAIVRLFKTPERLLSAKRWIWLLVILLGEIVGAVVFLAVGRRPAPAEEPQRTAPNDAASQRASRAADVLYGPRDGDQG